MSDTTWMDWVDPDKRYAFRDKVLDALHRHDTTRPAPATVLVVHPANGERARALALPGITVREAREVGPQVFRVGREG